MQVVNVPNKKPKNIGYETNASILNITYSFICYINISLYPKGGITYRNHTVHHFYHNLSMNMYINYHINHTFNFKICYKMIPETSKKFSLTFSDQQLSKKNSEAHSCIHYTSLQGWLSI